MSKLAIAKTTTAALFWLALVVLAAVVACHTGSPSPGGETPPVPPDAGEAGGGALELIASPTSDPDAVEVDVRQGPDLSDRTRSAEVCPGLDSVLYEISESPDPVALAQRIGIPAREDKIQVTLVLDGSDIGFLSAYDAEVGTQVGSDVQAYVPVEQLCEIAALDVVLRIRPAATGTSQ